MTLGAIVLLGARLLLENLGAGVGRITAASREADSDANGERLLRALVGQVEVGTQLAGSFGGDARAAHFTSWCATPGGWRERCRVALEVEMRGGDAALVAHLPWGEPVALRRAEGAIALRYLIDAREGGTWFVSWGDGLTAPRAIGVIAGSDTLIVRIGERG